MDRTLGKNESKRLLTKLQMKYGAEVETLQALIKSDMEVHGYVTPETDAKRDKLFATIKEEEKNYKW